MTQRVLGSIRFPPAVPSQINDGSDGTIVGSAIRPRPDIHEKCSTVMKFSALAEVQRATVGVLARYRRPREDSPMGHSLNTQQVDSVDSKNTEVVTDES